MKLLLTSSGIKNDYISKALLDLVGKPAGEISFAFIPTAANLEEGDKGWLIDNLAAFQKQGFKLIDIVDVSAMPSENWKLRLEGADVICVGGGSEQYLAKVFAEVGMKEFLDSILQKKVYMGISAGSMVTGQFLSSEQIEIVFPEEPMTEHVSTLNLVDFCFIPHLNSQWFTQARIEVLEKLKDRLEHTVYALDDETALTVVDGKVEVVGKGDYWISNT